MLLPVKKLRIKENPARDRLLIVSIKRTFGPSIRPHKGKSSSKQVSRIGLKSNICRYVFSVIWVSITFIPSIETPRDNLKTRIFFLFIPTFLLATHLAAESPRGKLVHVVRFSDYMDYLSVVPL